MGVNNYERLDMLSDMLGPEFVDNLMVSYRTEGRASLERLAVLSQTGDAARIKNEARRFHGTCQKLGFLELVALCEEIEEGADRGERCSQKCAALKRARNDFAPVVEAWLAAQLAPA